MKRKATKKDIMRRWGLPEAYQSQNLRYQTPIEKGIYWYWTSIEVRKRDMAQWGTCISCGKLITFEGSQAGHFIPAASCGRDLLFDSKNINAECAHCNAWDEMHLLSYAEGLDNRYGAGTSASLRQRHREYKEGPPVRDWKPVEYEQKITQLPAYQTAVREVADTKT